MADAKQTAEDRRRQRAIETLKQHDIEVGPNNRMSLEQIEALATVTRMFR
jgi:hypothetical protein